jgi:molybdopterin-synthase adenylyltransferase
MHPKIKDSISVLYRQKGDIYEVNFLLNASSVVLPFELNEPAFKCLQYLDGKHSLKQISGVTGLNKIEVRGLLSVLRQAKVLCGKSVTPSTSEKTRFTTQLNFFAEFETEKLSREEMQQRLKVSHVTIIGLGGIGTWAAQGLILAGVGKFTLVDPDTVELANLNRQCLFTLLDVGKPKAETIAGKFTQIDSDIHIRVLQKKILSREDCLDAAHEANLIINCADEPRTDVINRIVTEAGHKLNTPHILCGGYDGHLSFLGPTIIPGKSACWYCYERALDKQLDRTGYQHLQVTPSHIQGGNIGAISAITANYHVLEAIKVLTGFAPPTMFNRTAELDFLTLGINFRDFKKWRKCFLCGKKGGN